MISPKPGWTLWERMRVENLETSRQAANITAREHNYIQSPEQVDAACFMEESAFLNATAEAFGITRSEIEWAVMANEVEWRQTHWNQNEARLRGEIRPVECRRWMPEKETLPTWEQWIKKLADRAY